MLPEQNSSFAFVRTQRVFWNFATVALPLNNKIQKDQLFNLEPNKNEIIVMTGLQKKLFSLLVLALPYLQGQVTLDTDACDVQVGCVTLQEQSEKDRKSQLGTGLVRSKALTTCTTRRNESVLP